MPPEPTLGLAADPSTVTSPTASQKRPLADRVGDRVVKVRNGAELAWLVRSSVRRRRRDPQPLPTLPELDIVFIAGCPRSGTSWLNEIFSKHPDAVGNTESHIWPDIVAPVARAGRDHVAAWKPGLDRYDLARRKNWNIRLPRYVDRPELLAFVRQAIAAPDVSDRDAGVYVAHASLDRFLDRIGATPSVTKLVEKTPSHILYGSEILRVFPRARMIEIVRDGRDVAVSLQHLDRPWASNDRRTQIELWVDHVEAGKRLRADAAVADRVATVRYEEMRADPKPQIARLLAFAGLDNDPAIVDSLQSATDFSNYKQTGQGLHKRRGAVGDWKHDLSGDDVALFDSLAGPLLTELGYR